MKIYPSGGDGKKKSQIDRVLRLNPQLQSLEIPFIGYTERLRNICQSLTNLQCLVFNRSNYFYTLNEMDDLYCFKRVKKFVVRFNYRENDRQPVLHFRFPQLEVFHYLTYCERTGNHEKFYSFANRHPYINFFLTIIDGLYEEEEIIRMVLRILPLVREFGLGCKNFTHSCAIKIINQCDKLERYRFWRDTIER